MCWARAVKESPVAHSPPSPPPRPSFPGPHLRSPQRPPSRLTVCFCVLVSLCVLSVNVCQHDTLYPYVPVPVYRYVPLCVCHGCGCELDTSLIIHV